MKKLLLAFLLAPLLSFGQSDTTALADSIWANFPDNTSGFITPERLRNVALELSISNANLFEANVFSEPQEFEDSVKTTDGFYTWNGSAWEAVSDQSDTTVWSRSGGFILPLEYSDKLRVDTARFDGLLYPGGNVNLGQSSAPFDTVFADEYKGSNAQFTGSLFTSVNLSAGNAVVTNRIYPQDGGNILINNSDTLQIDVDVLNYVDGNQADGKVLKSDASGNASWTNVFAYGEMGFGDSLSTVALTQNVPAWLTNGNNDLWSEGAVTLNGITYSNDSLICNTDGVYEVNLRISGDLLLNDVLKVGVYKNGTLSCTCQGEITSPIGGTVEITYVDIISLSADDVLQVYITNTANNNDFDAISAKITTHKVGN